MKFNTYDLYWAAGFIEGEGAFLPRWGGITVSQVQREPLERLQRMFGGNIRAHKDRTIYIWNLCGTNGRGLMMTLFTLMSPRRQWQIAFILREWRDYKYESKKFRLSSKTRQEVRDAVSAGMRECDIARKFGVHRMTAKYYMTRYALAA